MRELALKVLWAFAALAGLALAGCEQGKMGMIEMSNVDMLATLSGTSEVPPLTVQGAGKAVVIVDKTAKTMSWDISYTALSGDAKAAHFHGPAPAGANAGVAMPITVGPSPMKGSAQLSDAQMADLLAGKWYVNIHTAAHAGGEIRGQVGFVKK